ncbi:MAG TPA: M1 family aminopeptidase [Chitinophagaceae bacterium]|nr:M1 family aminopeptidase [Chitinophagaceae bacterium]
MNLYSGRFGCLLFPLLFFAQPAVSQKSKTPVEPGVSLILAQQREELLTDVRYSLSFSIPALVTETISALATINFNFRKTGEPLQIDFKEDSHHLKSVAVNGKHIPAILEQEHIVVATEYLLAGNNSIDVQFTAGERSLNRNPDFLYSLLVPDRARTLFPCFDQPGIKARFKLSLALPASWSALANAPVEDSMLSGDRKTIIYKESDLFSTYLFSFVAGNFEKATKEIDGRLFTFYFRETNSTKLRLSIDTVFQAHAAAIKYLEKYTGIDYPFQKLDFAAIPDFQYGGMEHVGAIYYRSASLFLDSGATKDQQNARSNLIAHEVSHMWFGNLVTMKWFNDVWMKEVFANFIADKITQGNENDTTYALKFLLSHVPDAYAIDRTAGANAIRQRLDNLQEAGTLYGPIIYDKAPVMMRQLELLMGQQAFEQGVRDYMKMYSFKNADWSDLIRILSKHTTSDLKTWNQVWVNTPGRPIISYQMKQKKGRLKRLRIRQTGERGDAYMLPQVFEITFVYPDRIEPITVNLRKQKLNVKKVSGKLVPSQLIFNSSGQGYGLFPIDSRIEPEELASTTIQLTNPITRASAYINWYENMLSQRFWNPSELLHVLNKLIIEEKEELNLSLLAGQLTDIYWRLIPASERNGIAPSLEALLLQAVHAQATPNNKKIAFKAFQSIAVSKSSLQALYDTWKHQHPPAGVTYSEDDYTSLALNLMVKEHNDTSILQQQLLRISNPDRQARLQFLVPALSASQALRDSFFESLQDEKIREKESWVAAALAYLHHPLRAPSSIKYLPKSLEMLQEIQATGDIFFPEAWLNASLGSYQSSEAAEMVRTFLRANPTFNPKLKAKILQAADPLFRAEKLLQH